MNYFVYIIFSDKTRRYYIGQTSNLNRRIEEHNSGEGKSTKNGLPWVLVHQEMFSTRSEAMKKEQEIKNRGAERYLAH